MVIQSAYFLFLYNLLLGYICKTKHIYFVVLRAGFLNFVILNISLFLIALLGNDFVPLPIV